jgi:hypothetical protein
MIQVLQNENWGKAMEGFRDNDNTDGVIDMYEVYVAWVQRIDSKGRLGRRSK